MLKKILRKSVEKIEVLTKKKFSYEKTHTCLECLRQYWKK